MSTKNPMTPAGIESATFRFVAQHLNHCNNNNNNNNIFIAIWLSPVGICYLIIVYCLLQNSQILVGHNTMRGADNMANWKLIEECYGFVKYKILVKK